MKYTVIWIPTPVPTRYPMLPLPKNDFASPSKSYFTQLQVFFSYLSCTVLSSELSRQEPQQRLAFDRATQWVRATSSFTPKSSKSAPQAPSRQNGGKMYVSICFGACIWSSVLGRALLSPHFPSTLVHYLRSLVSMCSPHSLSCCNHNT